METVAAWGAPIPAGRGWRFLQTGVEWMQGQDEALEGRVEWIKVKDEVKRKCYWIVAQTYSETRRNDILVKYVENLRVK